MTKLLSRIELVLRHSRHGCFWQAGPRGCEGRDYTGTWIARPCWRLEALLNLKKVLLAAKSDPGRVGRRGPRPFTSPGRGLQRLADQHERFR